MSFYQNNSPWSLNQSRLSLIFGASFVERPTQGEDSGPEPVRIPAIIPLAWTVVVA
jgi:hypothetical protein